MQRNPCTLTSQVCVSPRNTCTYMCISPSPRNLCTLSYVASEPAGAWTHAQVGNMCEEINQNYNLFLEQITHCQETNILDYKGEENQIIVKPKVYTTAKEEHRMYMSNSQRNTSRLHRIHTFRLHGTKITLWRNKSNLNALQSYKKWETENRYPWNKKNECKKGTRLARRNKRI
jgi:hypothetical protein